MRIGKIKEPSFWSYALPSMFAQLLNSLFIIVDGYYVGRNLGDVGLAAINIAWPMVAVVQAFSMAIGVGGAVRMAMDAGRGDMKSARAECMHSMLLLIISVIIFGFGSYLLYPSLLPLLGARGELYPLTAEYIEVVCIFCSCQVLSTGILPLLRSQGRAITAMVLTVVGLISNCYLDWLFIEHYPWGMAGSALATAISQAACAIPGIIILFRDKTWSLRFRGIRYELRRMADILRFGFSTFGLNMSVSILILFTNLQALRYGATEGVAVYAVYSYIMGSVIPLVSGVGDGIQPLLSHAYGAGKLRDVEKLRRDGLALAVGTAVLCSLVCWIFRAELPALFGTSPSATARCEASMWTLILAIPFMAAVRFLCSYFCALGITSFSSILAYGEPLAAQPLFLFLLPLFMGLEGVWVSYPAAMILMALISFLLLIIHKRRPPEQLK